MRNSEDECSGRAQDMKGSRRNIVAATLSMLHSPELHLHLALLTSVASQATVGPDDASIQVREQVELVDHWVRNCRAIKYQVG